MILPVLKRRWSRVQKLDAFYLYRVGFSLHPLTDLQAGGALDEWRFRFWIARYSLDALLNKSIFPLRTCRVVGARLLEHLVRITDNADQSTGGTIDPYDAYSIGHGMQEFETLINAELGVMDIYLVVKKRGYDTADLIDSGETLFPTELAVKVPEAIPDIQQAARCIAFELPTAAGFHLHRANESVLHRYYDAVTSGAPRPTGRNMGGYLAELNNLNKGSPQVRSALKDLKDLHRNPLIHPEHSLNDVDDALALMGSIHAVIVHMLRELPLPVLPPATTP